MKRFFTTFGVLTVSALLLAPLAMAQTVPTIPVSAYGGSLLSELGDAIGQVLPYAAAVTAFAIGVGMLRRWLGHRKATQV